MRLPLHPLWRDDQRLVGVVIFVHDQMRDIGQPQAGAHQKLIHVSEGVAELVSRLPDGSQLCAAEHAGPNARLSWRRHSLFRRSEERRVGQEWVSTVNYRLEPYH